MDREFRRRRLGIAVFFTFLALLATGCASTPTARMRATASGRGAAAAASPVFSTIEDAALAGLEAARQNVSPADRQTIRIGTIRAVAGGYQFQPPTAASADLHATGNGVVRLRLVPEDVATYVVHPTSGDRRIDRANARLSRSEHALMVGANGRPRPLFLMTPRLDVVKHSAGGDPLRIASLRRGRGEARSSESTAQRDEVRPVGAGSDRRGT